MEIETIGKVVGVAAALYPIGKGVSEWMNERVSKMRDEYRFSKEFLSDCNDAKCPHPYALEKGYQALAGLFVPAAMPEPIVAKLREACAAAANDSRVIQTINTAGSPILYLDQAGFERYVQSESVLMRDVVKRIGRVE